MMHSTKDRELAIALIKNDYINTRLVSGLNALGMDASDYYLQLYEPICRLSGLEVCDAVCDHYFMTMSQAALVDLGSEQALNELAEVLYQKLLEG